MLGRITVPKLWKVGLVGGIGSGKTNVTSVLRRLGAHTIDADLLGHQAYQKDSPAYHKVVNHFGKECLTPEGEINRGFIGSKVFSNKTEMKNLTDIVWPEIRRLATLEMNSLEEAGKNLVFLEAAILLEAGWLDLVDEVWVMSVPPEVACQRIMKRNGLNEDQAKARINSQVSNEEREKHGDVIIRTNQPIEDTNKQIQQHYENLLDKLNKARTQQAKY